MNKKLLLIILLFLHIKVNAKIDSTKLKNRIDYSMNISLFKGNRGNQFFENSISKYRYSKEVDLSLRYYLTKRFYLRPTLLVSKFNFEFLPINSINIKEKFNKLRILLPFGIQFPLNKHHIFIEAGFGYNFLINSSVHFIDSKEGIETNNYDNIPSYYLRKDKNSQSLIRLSGGFSIKMSKSVSLNFAVFLENSNVSIYDKTPPFDSANLNYYYTGFSIGLMYSKY